MTEDPIGFAGGDLNLYAYVWNRPTTCIDPYGLWGFGWPDFVSPLFPAGPGCATYFLATTFFDFQQVNNGALDKYYHCLAFCKVGKHCGLSGLAFAIGGGLGKEGIDCLLPVGSCEPLNDVKANLSGINASDKPVCCEKACSSLLP